MKRWNLVVVLALLAVCAGAYAADKAPDDHTTLWKKRTHGQDVREQGSKYCASCHKEASCASCHRREKPRDHSNYFRRKGHGIESSVDRERCMSCHQVDKCIRCHQNGRAIPSNARHATATDCRACHGSVSHFDSGFNTCRVCHR